MPSYTPGMSTATPVAALATPVAEDHLRRGKATHKRKQPKTSNL